MKSAIFIAVACTSARDWYGEVRAKLRDRAACEEYNIGLACGRGLLPYISGLLEPLSCPTKLASAGLLVETGSVDFSMFLSTLALHAEILIIRISLYLISRLWSKLLAVFEPTTQPEEGFAGNRAYSGLAVDDALVLDQDLLAHDMWRVTTRMAFHWLLSSSLRMWSFPSAFLGLVDPDEQDRFAEVCYRMNHDPESHHNQAQQTLLKWGRIGWNKPIFASSSGSKYISGLKNSGFGLKGQG